MTMITQSESLSDNITGICRLCLKQEGPMSSIFGTAGCPGSGDKEALSARITSIAQVQINPTDGLPESICHVCRQQVNKFYDFRLLVEISDRKLRCCFQGAQSLSEFPRGCRETAEKTQDDEYQESSVENISGGKDLVSVKAILVPSTSGMQVWQICNVEENIVPEKIRSINTRIGESVQLEYSVDSSDCDDFEGVKRCLAQAVTQRAIKTIKKENELCFRTTTIPNEDQANSEEDIRLEFVNDEDSEDIQMTADEYSCQLCFTSFQALDALKRHVEDHLLSKKRRSSSESPENQETEDSYVEKEEEEDDEIDQINEDDIVIETEFVESFNCESCDENFETMEERLLHNQRDVGSLVFKCRHCENFFFNMSQRKCHEESIHGTRMIGKTHKCDECEREFSKRSELRYHKGTHTTSPSICSICNKIFRNVQSFKMHLKRHTLGSRYNCSDCGKSYYTNSELARHVQQHKGTREFPCDLCDMSFLSRPELNRHVKYHNGEKKFKCKICSKSYYESGHLKVHERVHTGERPFACTVCEKGFITKSKLVRHIKIHERADRGR